MMWTTVHLDSFVDLAMLELDKAGGDGGDVALLVRESNPSSALELSLSPGVIVCEMRKILVLDKY